jgi:hypothetical protein
MRYLLIILVALAVAAVVIAQTTSRHKFGSTASTEVGVIDTTGPILRTVAQIRALRTDSHAPVPQFIQLTDPGKAGIFALQPDDIKSTDNTGIILVTGSGLRYKRLNTESGINVRWFGALGNGLNNDRDAIQAAVDYAKSQTSANGGTVRVTVLLPAGNYRINGQRGIDVTNANGIVLQGTGNAKYVATGINGNCGGSIIDFTGSTMSGCQGISFFSDAAEKNPSPIAVTFALGMDNKGRESGGLSCFMRDCYIQMADMPDMNGGFGSIPVLNIRSEQFSLADCVLKGNMGIMYTNRADVVGRKNSYTFAGNFFPIKTGVGSMGVISNRAVSIETNGTSQPGLFLNGVNSLDFQGYLAIGNKGSGRRATQEYAIEQYQPMFSTTIHGTIEGFRAIMYQAANASNYQSELRLSYANVQGALDTDVFHLENGARMDNMNLGVVFGNGSAEMGKRTFIGTPLLGNGDGPTLSAITNSRISCSNWPDNVKFISPALLKQSENTAFLSSQPVEKKAGELTYMLTHPIKLGIDNVASNGTISGKVLRFNAADHRTRTAGNGGYYKIKLMGVVDIGGINPASLADFTTVILVQQSIAGIRQASMQTTTITSRVNATPDYVTIRNITGYVRFEGDVGIITLTVNTSGRKKGEGVNFNGVVSLQSNFVTNQSMLFD